MYCHADEHLDNIEMGTISKGPNWIVDKENFAFTLTYNLKHFPAGIELRIQSHYLLHMYFCSITD